MNDSAVDSPYDPRVNTGLTGQISLLARSRFHVKSMRLFTQPRDTGREDDRDPPAKRWDGHPKLQHRATLWWSASGARLTCRQVSAAPAPRADHSVTETCRERSNREGREDFPCFKPKRSWRASRLRGSTRSTTKGRSFKLAGSDDHLPVT